MKKLIIQRVIKTVFFLSAIFATAVKADVFLDTSQTDEISIANTETDRPYTLRFKEPVASHEVALSAQHRKSISQSTDSRNLPFNTEVMIAAIETEIEPALIHAVITVESQHNPHAKSKKGAYGLMQLMPETSRRFNVLDRNDPKQNVLAGAKYLRELLTLYNGNLKLTLAAYNAGPAAVQRYGGHIPPYKETIDYVPKVLKYYLQYS